MTSTDIYSFLSSKTHNPHYLKRYYNFILYCNIKNKNLSKDSYKENHHICPKAKDLFPEYKNLKKYPWNNSILTGRQHFIAHWLLWKTFPSSTMSTAFTLMNRKCKGKNKLKISSKSYQKLKEDYSIINSKSQIGKKWDTSKPHFNIGRKASKETKEAMSNSRRSRPRKPHTAETVKNISNALKKRCNSNNYIHPKGMLDKSHSTETKLKISKSHKGRVWWNNGITTCMSKTCPGPNWKKGRKLYDCDLYDNL